MKKTTAILSAIGAFAVGAVAAVFGVKALVHKETGKSLDEILTEKESTLPCEPVPEKEIPEEMVEIIAAVEAAAEENIAVGSDAKAEPDDTSANEIAEASVSEENLSSEA